MARFELSITAEYAPDWSVWEGLREVMQNALDSHDEGYPAYYNHDNGWLEVTNRDCVLDTSVWLLGKSTKRDNDALRGQHGDGLKVGVLALLRQGIEVKFLNGDEIWTPAIEASKNYAGVDVLAVKVRKRRQDYYGDRPTSDFTVRIKISKRQWNDYKDRFLRCIEIPDHEIQRVGYSGSILFGQNMKGRIYCKGIYVCTKPELAVGYDFASGLDLDRDRRMVDDYDLGYAAAQLWTSLCAHNEDEDWISNVWGMLESDMPDVKRLAGCCRYSNKEVGEQISATFADTYGDKAVPVANEDEATKVSFYGLQGIVVPDGMGKVLANKFGTIEEILNKAIDSSGDYVAVADLDPQERVNWNKAINLLDLADVADRDRLDGIRCFGFTAPDAPLGTYSHGSKEIRINRQVTGKLQRLLGTMIHELAHDKGRDGSLSHRSAEETMWEDVFGIMAEMAGTDWLMD